MITDLNNYEIVREPFDHVVIDNFFEPSFADVLEKEFPDFNSDIWYSYDNPLEVKKTNNFWDRFPPATYQTFSHLCSFKFEKIINEKFKTAVSADIGLNGGGWHIHKTGGKLNVHLDYSIHPKIPYQRKFNIIIYLSKNWDPAWGGGLEFWSHDPETNRPKELVKKYDLVYNRAILFDTTQHSWHGFPQPITCPEGVYRKSLAVYYIQQPDASAIDRYKVLYAPTEEQKGNPEIEKIIEERSKVKRE
jgi:hypothetical protein